MAAAPDTGRVQSEVELLHKALSCMTMKAAVKRYAETIANAPEIPQTRVPYETLIRRHDFLDAEQLLYADIDLNTVGRSAIWMSSMASILANGGNTIVTSKNPIRRTTIVDNIHFGEKVLILSPSHGQSPPTPATASRFQS